MAKALLMVVCCVFLVGDVSAQLSDIISVQKRNGRNIRTFGKGSPITFITRDGFYVSGHIKEVKDDTLMLLSYDIRPMPTIWGVSIVDTLATFLSPYAVRDIARVELHKKKFSEVSIGKLMIIGGGSYLLLNTLNGNYLNQPFGDPKNLSTLGISAGVMGVGFLVSNLSASKKFSGRRHRIVYTRLR